MEASAALAITGALLLIPFAVLAIASWIVLYCATSNGYGHYEHTRAKWKPYVKYAQWGITTAAVLLVLIVSMWIMATWADVK